MSNPRSQNGGVDPPDGMQPPPEQERRKLLQTVFDEFEETGDWPSIDRLERQLVQEMDVHEVLKGLGHPWVHTDNGKDRTIELRLPAIAICDGSEKIADAFIRTLQLAVKKYFSSDPTPEFSQQEIASKLNLDTLRARQAMILYKNENLWSSISGPIPGEGCFKVDRNVRPYRDVETVQEYVERRYGSDLQAHSLSGAQSSHRIASKPERTPMVFLSHSGSLELVSTLSNFLQKILGSEIQVWSDADLPGGRWDEHIREKLGETSAFVLVGTPSILTSVYAGFETGYVDARLGQRNVFLLRLGVQVSQLQNRPPLSHYQSFDGTKPATLEEFCVKLCQEMGVQLLDPINYDEQAALFDEVVRANEQSADVDSPSTKDLQISPLFEVAKEDMTLWDRVSRIACTMLGESGASGLGRVLMVVAPIPFLGLIGGLVFFQNDRSSDLGWLPFAIYGVLAAFFFGFFLRRAAEHRRDRRCDTCNANYALEEVGTPFARDLPVSGGPQAKTRRITERRYKCMNCGKEATITWTRTFPTNV